MIDQEGVQQGVVNLDQAKYLAFDAGLDLVEVNSASEPPVVKIMDYGKYRYLQEKQESKQKFKSKGPDVKEVRLSLKINPHDLEFKIKQTQKFIDDGDKVKISLKLIGREMIHKNKAFELIENFRQKTNTAFESKVERLGNQFSVILIGKKNETKNQ